MKPNLFDYATSELSQDAFLCWLLKWGEADLRSVDQELHRVATRFIHKVFSLHNRSLEETIHQVRIIRQFKGLDILAIINEKYAILIEDKTFTSEHSGQLERYLEEVKTNVVTRDCIPLPIYYKIVEQSNHRSIHKADYQLFTRQEMIKILEHDDWKLPKNAILADYLQHLKRLDDEINSYKTLPVAKWTTFSWQGFYRDLQDVLDGKWGYVANARGGFWGFWWGKEKKLNYYLQLEQTILKAKIKSKSKQKLDLKTYRDQVMNDVLTDSKNRKLSLAPPKVLRIGKTMTIAHRQDYLQLFPDGCIDMEATIRELQRYDMH